MSREFGHNLWEEILKTRVQEELVKGFGNTCQPPLTGLIGNMISSRLVTI